MMLTHHRGGRQRQRSRSRDRAHPHAQVPQVLQIQPVVIHEPHTVSDEASAVVNPSSPSPDCRRQLNSEVGPEENRDPDRVSEHLHMYHLMPASSHNLLHLLLKFSRSRITRGTDEESATVEPQSCVSDRSRSPQRKESPQKQRKLNPWIQIKTMKYLKMSLKLLLTQPVVPVLPLHQGPAASSQGPAASNNAADEDSEYSDEYSARSQYSARTVLYPRPPRSDQ